MSYCRDAPRWRSKMQVEDDGKRVGDLLRGEEESVLRQWVSVAAASLQGRLSAAELERTCGELLALLVEAVESGVDVGAEAYAGARGLLSELLRAWARRG